MLKNKHIRNSLILFLVAVALLAVDLVAKNFLFHSGDSGLGTNNPNYDWNIQILAGKSILSKSTTFFRSAGSTLPLWGGYIVNFMFAALFLIAALFVKRKGIVIGFGIVIAGIIGNTIDIYFNSGIREIFVAPWWGDLTFNFASIFIVIGVLTAAITFIVTELKRVQSQFIKNAFILLIALIVLLAIDLPIKHFLYDSGDLGLGTNNPNYDWNIKVLAGQSVLNTSTTFFEFAGTSLPLWAGFAINFSFVGLLLILTLLIKRRGVVIGLAIMLAGVFSNSMDIYYHGGIRETFVAPWWGDGTFNLASIFMIVGLFVAIGSFAVSLMKINNIKFAYLIVFSVLVLIISDFVAKNYLFHPGLNGLGTNNPNYDWDYKIVAGQSSLNTTAVLLEFISGTTINSSVPAWSGIVLNASFIVLFIFMMRFIKNKGVIVGLLIALSGFFANTIDNIFYNGVRDIFVAPWWGDRTFNFASLFIVIGVITMGVSYLASLIRKRKYIRNTLIMLLVVAIFLTSDLLLKGFLFEPGDNGLGTQNQNYDWNIKVLAGRSLLHTSTTFLDFVGGSIPAWSGLLINFAIIALFIGMIFVMDSKGVAVGLAIILSGVMGNTVDNIFFDGVRDIFATPWWDRGTFNFADALVICGIIVAIVSYIVFIIKNKHSKKVKVENIVDDNDSKESDTINANKNLKVVKNKNSELKTGALNKVDLKSKKVES